MNTDANLKNKRVVWDRYPHAYCVMSSDDGKFRVYDQPDDGVRERRQLGESWETAGMAWHDAMLVVRDRRDDQDCNEQS